MKLICYPTPSLPCSHCRARFPRMSFSTPHRNRTRRRRPLKRSTFSQPSNPDSDTLQVVIDVDHLKSKASNSLQRALELCEVRVGEIADSAYHAYWDLKTLITVDHGTNKMVISCRDSTVRFVGGAMIWSFVAVVVFRVLLKLGLGLMRWSRKGIETVEVVTRRDRSLGGKEVVVGTRRPVETERKKYDVRDLERFLGTDGANSNQRKGKKLPQWWPATTSKSQVLLVDTEGYQRAANRLIREITDDKMSGKDISEADILELRQICRISGVKAIIETANTRNTLYRSSVDFVINAASRAGSPSIDIDGEDPRVFIAGLADNIDLPAIRAASIVSGTVAARTRLWFLQAWASEIQGGHSKALEDLSRICVIHKLFPPEPASPEMEMVALGLEKHLKREEREFLMRALVEVCGEDSSSRSASEALGLEYPLKPTDVQQVDRYTDS
ncbi:hypothetical protein V2J09_021105 [Rumex salicifolius]